MKILILNWRDSKNPRAGGAEKITQEYASFWVSKSHEVFWLSNAFNKSTKNQTIDGVSIFRVEPKLSDSALANLILYPIYILATIFKAQQIIKNENIDLVIDEIHGLPFFAPFYSKKRNILLVCEVAGEIWDKMYPFPINIIGKNLERFIYSLYGKTETWAISKNTKTEIHQINPNIKVKILPIGIDVQPNLINKKDQSLKYDFPAAVFIARLVKMKGVEIAINAAEQIVKKEPNFKLFIIGKGEQTYEDHLKKLVKDKKMESVIQFLGFVSEDKKYEILAKSHFLIHPSYKEGFGLTVLEAGLVKTPAIVKSGSSLDELIDDNVNGFIVEDAMQIAEKFISIYGKPQYNQMAKNAQTKALKYKWNYILNNSSLVTFI